VAEAGTAKAVSAREQRRLHHQDLSRTQLLDAAEEVFGRKGFHDTTLKEVAERAEFSVGSVYSFFANKDDLFRQIFVRRGDEFMAGLRSLVADAIASPSELLHRLVDFEIGFFRNQPNFGRLYLHYSSAIMLTTDRDVDAYIADNYEEAMRLQTGLIEQGQRSGAFRSGDPQVLARLFSGIVSAYQALDPAVMSDDPSAEERLPLAELHDVVAAAFAAPASAPAKNGSRS
jgi:TetR/AcrR family transcriptional regulator